MKGGYRLGAGRKKGFAAKSSEEARKIFSEMLMREIEPIAKALITKAKRGDVAAARELFDRSWGKATQQTENAGVNGPRVWNLPVTVIDNKQPGSMLKEYEEFMRSQRKSLNSGTTA